MKTKILLIFVLFTISLFGQFEDNGDGFIVGVEEKYKELKERQEVSCRIFAFDNNPRLLITFIAPELPSSFNIGNTIFYFPETEKKDGIYHGLITQHADITTILKSIVEGKYIFLNSENIAYIFDFSEYKNDIIKSKFYKKIMQ